LQNKWYISGLNFQCDECGNCCSGPQEGFIWITKPEIKFLADYLSISVEEVHQKYLKRFGFRTTIIEEQISKDCIFLDKIDGQKKCSIYPVRPDQCRTWPFWNSNLESPNSWSEAARNCGGINRGKLYSIEEIENSRKQKKWWDDGQK